MNRLLQALTILVLAGTVLAFGGVHPITYSLAEVTLFLAALLRLVSQARQGRIKLSLPIWPFLFALWAAFELVPLPVQLVAKISPARALGPNLDSLSAGVSHAITLSIDPHGTVEALLKVLAYLCAFALAACLTDLSKRANPLIRALVIIGCFEAGYGIVQYLTGWQKIFTYTKVFDLNEATGTYINRNHYAGLLEMILPLILASAFYAFERRFDNSGGNGSGGGVLQSSMRFRTVFFLLLLAFACVALVFSRSRGGILAAIFSLLFIALLGQARIRGKGWMLFVVLVLTVVIGYGLWIGLNPVFSRFESMGESDFHLTEARSGIWRDALSLVRESPLTGTGLGTFATANRRFQTVALDKYVDHAHSDYLEFLAETGIIGVALLFLPIFYLLVKMILAFLGEQHRYPRSVLLGCIGSTLAMLIHSAVDFNLQIPANALVFAVILGIGYRAARGDESQEEFGRS